MRLKLLAALATSIACWSSVGIAEEAGDVIRPAELPAEAPLYCDRGESVVERLDGVTVGTFHTALRNRFPTWPARIGLAHPDKSHETLIAVFGDFADDNSFNHLVRLYLTKRELGWAVVYADFVEPDRPLMHSVGEPLCDYVAEVVGRRAAT